MALDTSVAIPLLVLPHPDHVEVTRWCRDRDLVLAGHTVAETYAVLTRLPTGLRASPAQAAEVIAGRFGPPALLSKRAGRRLPALLAEAGIAGGAVYDAMVALAAREAGLVLATRDAKALGTYRALGAEVTVVG